MLAQVEEIKSKPERPNGDRICLFNFFFDCMVPAASGADKV